MGGGMVAGRLLSMFASAPAMVAMGVGAAAYGAYRENERNQQYLMGSGLRTGGAGLRGTIEGATGMPSYAQAGGLYDLFGGSGFLTERRQRQYTGTAAESYFHLHPEGFSSKALGRFSQTAQLTGAKPEELAKELGGGLEDLPLQEQEATKREREKRKHEQAIAQKNKSYQDTWGYGWDREKADAGMAVADAAVLQQTSTEATQHLKQVEWQKKQRANVIARTGEMHATIATVESEVHAAQMLRDAKLHVSETLTGLTLDPTDRLTAQLADIEISKTNNIARLDDTTTELLIDGMIAGGRATKLLRPPAS